ncbi:3-alpha-(or 20-beta)-hydroxysteroid dehydrogenase [Sphingobium sp. TA15]|uniref:2,5-dichloro-2,5-cyclohexadiene-1,4-diol dehydrogenase LinX n=6 Tax=Sphingomonadaceae TaxID=41297 RepID=LINX_SPHIU
MANRLAGKVALITGGASGLGAAQAKRFAEEGAKVVIGDLNEEMAKGVVAEIRAAGGDALFIRLDVTDAASWNNAIAAAVEAFGGLTTLSNTAGIIHPGGFEEESIEGWNKMVAVNQTAIFLGIKAAIPELVKSGNGSIINISSLIGMFPTAGNASYCATKAAVRIMSKAAALEFVDRGVRVNTIVPGGMNTPITANVPPDVLKQQTSQIPMGKLGDPIDIANGALFLASDEAKYITGVDLPIDGGWSVGV